MAFDNSDGLGSAFCKAAPSSGLGFCVVSSAPAALQEGIGDDVICPHQRPACLVRAVPGWQAVVGRERGWERVVLAGASARSAVLGAALISLR